MPLAILSVQDALETSRTNAESRWPTRGVEPNRLEPVPLPRFSPSFQIARGDRVITIGSCFSRHIENSLALRGMVLPARDVFRRPEFSTMGSRYLNNFSVPSILNEMAWATGENLFSVEDNLVEEAPGLFCDIHLNSGIAPAPIEVLVERRNALMIAYGQICYSEMIICTLGNTECWYDKQTKLYLNTPPSEIVLGLFPLRFEIHVLGFDDIKVILESLIDMLKRNGPPQLGVVLAVAPWPQTATYLDRDIILSATYSKAALRAAVDEVAARHERVDYFPIYEEMAYSDRAIWRDDFVHIEPSVIDASAARLLRAYVKSEIVDDDDLAARLDPDEPGVTPARIFGELENHWDVLERRPVLALRFASAAVKLGKIAHARQAIDLAGDATDSPEKLWIEAQILFSEHRYDDLIPILESTTGFQRRPPYWVMMLTALFETGRLAQAKAAVAEWAKLSPASSEPYRMAAVFLSRTGDGQGTRYMFAKAKALARTPAQLDRINLEHGEYLASLGRTMLAREAIKDIQASTGALQARVGDLKLRLNMK
jgi:hypothetical protein